MVTHKSLELNQIEILYRNRNISNSLKNVSFFFLLVSAASSHFTNPKLIFRGPFFIQVFLSIAKRSTNKERNIEFNNYNNIGQVPNVGVVNR